MKSGVHEMKDKEGLKFTAGRLLGSVAVFVAVFARLKGLGAEYFNGEENLTFAAFGELYLVILVLLFAGVALAVVGNLLYGLLIENVLGKTKFTNNPIIKSLVVGLATMGLIWCLYIWW